MFGDWEVIVEDNRVTLVEKFWEEEELVKHPFCSETFKDEETAKAVANFLREIIRALGHLELRIQHLEKKLGIDFWSE